MTSTNHDIAGTDPASEALILQLIAQDFGQEIPQTLPEINSGSDHQEANSQRHNQGSDSQWNIQDPDDHWDIPGSDNEENQALEPSDNQSGLPAEQELRDSHSSPDPSETTTPYVEDHNVEEMAKRSREAEDLEPGGDATGSGVPAYADFYHSNDSHRPSDNVSNKRAKVDSNAGENWNGNLAWASPDSMDRSNSPPQDGGVGVPETIDIDDPGHNHNIMTEHPIDADNTTQAIPAATGATDRGEGDNDIEDFEDESEDYEGDGEHSQGDGEHSQSDSDDEEDELSALDAMDALAVHDDDNEDSTESEDDRIEPLPTAVTQAATLRPVTYDPETLRTVTYNPNTANTNTRKANNEGRIPVIQIPWQGVAGWMESYVYENSGYSLNDLSEQGRHRRRGGPTIAHMLQNQLRMMEEEPVDIILEEHETADFLIGEMIKKEEEAKREAKGKGKAVD